MQANDVKTKGELFHAVVTHILRILCLRVPRCHNPHKHRWCTLFLRVTRVPRGCHKGDRKVLTASGGALLILRLPPVNKRPPS